MEKVHKEPHILVAYDQDRSIGLNNSIPWAGQLSADMRHFKQATTGNVVLMGRTTYDSIGSPLPGRENRILTRQRDLVVPGCSVYTDPEEALLMDYSDERELFVIGGEQIYNQYLGMSRFVTASVVDHAFNGDTFFPEISDDEWALIESHTVCPAKDGDYPFRLETYKKIYHYIDTSKARSAEQYEQFRRIEIEGECPFCPDAVQDASPDEMNVVGHEPGWTVINNMIPYENSEVHFVLIPDRHICAPSELTQDEWIQLHDVLQKYTSDLNFGGIAMRFGDFTQTGASVAHLHVHIIKPEDNLSAEQKVRFKISR